MNDFIALIRASYWFPSFVRIFWKVLVISDLAAGIRSYLSVWLNNSWSSFLSPNFYSPWFHSFSSSSFTASSSKAALNCYSVSKFWISLWLRIRLTFDDFIESRRIWLRFYLLKSWFTKSGALSFAKVAIKSRAWMTCQTISSKFRSALFSLFFKAMLVNLHLESP